MKVPYCIRDLKRDPNLENYPLLKALHGCLEVVSSLGAQGSVPSSEIGAWVTLTS